MRTLLREQFNEEELRRIYEELKELEKRHYINLSTFEKKIIFELENVGFVRKLSPRVFCLDPSPFAKQTRGEIFVLSRDTPQLPEDGTLVKVEIQNEISIPFGQIDNLRKVKVKEVTSWEQIPFHAVHKPHKDTLKLIKADLETAICSIFPHGFESAEGLSTALLLLSSPPAAGVGGGFKAALLGKSTTLRIFSRIYSVLPEEVRLQRCPKLSFRSTWGARSAPSRAREDNLHCFMNTLQAIVPLDIPLRLLEEDIRGANFAENELRSQLVTMWIHDPELNPEVLEYLLKKLEGIKSLLSPEVEQCLNVFSGASKISLAMGRMEFLDMVDRRSVRESIDLIGSLVEDSLDDLEVMRKVRRYYRLSLPARIIYKVIRDLGGEDEFIPLKELEEQCRTLERESFEMAIEELRDRSLIIVSRGSVRAVPL